MREGESPLIHTPPKLRRIDLAPEQIGSLCLICDTLGKKVTARLVDREQGPVCYACFSELLNLEARLAFATYEERQRERGAAI